MVSLFFVQNSYFCLSSYPYHILCLYRIHYKTSEKPTPLGVGWIAQKNKKVYVIIVSIHFLCYNRYMKNNYRNTKTTVSLINYHFVFCPRYRRKIFLIPDVENRFKELVNTKCEELEIEIIAMECDKDHVHLFLNCLPTLSPSDIMQNIKGYTSKILRNEFQKLEKMPSLWTRNFFVSTAGNVSSETIKEYVESQKKKYF